MATSSEMLPAPSAYQIHVRLVDGPQLDMAVEARQPVRVLRADVATQLRVRPSKLRLIFQGRLLQDGSTLGQAGLASDCTVHASVIPDAPTSSAPASAMGSASAHPFEALGQTLLDAFLQRSNACTHVLTMAESLPRSGPVDMPWICNRCGQHREGRVHYCSSCDFHLCANCFDMMEQLGQIREGRRVEAIMSPSEAGEASESESERAPAVPLMAMFNPLAAMLGSPALRDLTSGHAEPRRVTIAGTSVSSNDGGSSDERGERRCRCAHCGEYHLDEDMTDDDGSHEGGEDEEEEEEEVELEEDEEDEEWREEEAGAAAAGRGAPQPTWEVVVEPDTDVDNESDEQYADDDGDGDDDDGLPCHDNCCVHGGRGMCCLHDADQRRSTGPPPARKRRIVRVVGPHAPSAAPGLLTAGMAVTSGFPPRRGFGPQHGASAHHSAPSSTLPALARFHVNRLPPSLVPALPALASMPLQALRRSLQEQTAAAHALMVATMVAPGSASSVR